MENFIDFILEWGYWAVFFGAMIEGESIILTACVMAYLGYLSLTKIVMIAFVGTVFADQSLFYVGRFYGTHILKRFPRLRIPARKAFQLLHKWDIWFILSFRFIYGIRTISPIVIGASGVMPQRFIPLNLCAAVIWTGISCTGGYLLGSIIDSISFESLEKSILAVSALLLTSLVSLGIWGWRKLHASTTEIKDDI